MRRIAIPGEMSWLIPFRYQYHPPKYYRGPLHPVQSPPSSDPQARDFVPGPFNLPRLRDTYETTLAADLMTLTYLHKPPGTPDSPERVRLRPWDDSSPYHKNRPLRGPRGSSNLPILERNINWRNVPEIKAVSVNVFAPRATQNRDYLHIARSVVQAITGSDPEVTRVKHSVVQWKVRKGDKTGAKTTIYGNEAYEFVDKLIHLVLPKIKDWPGMKGIVLAGISGFLLLTGEIANAGDGSGNIGFGFKPAEMKFFPELEVNYDVRFHSLDGAKYLLTCRCSCIQLR